MSPSSTASRSPVSIVAWVVLLAATSAVVWRGWRTGGEAESAEPICGDSTVSDCSPLPSRSGAEKEGESSEVILPRSEACRDAGFLCAEMEAAGELRLLRWPRGTPRIRIHVPPPPGLPPSAAQALQRAAARGIRAWQGHPFPLSVTTRQGSEDEEVSVQWAHTVADGRLGLTRAEWTSSGTEERFQVVEFTLATHHPRDPGVQLTPEEVQLVAAHEMGHALGLPHSDDPRDVMFPLNTATHLSTRDFRTLDALYALPNGAVIR